MYKEYLTEFWYTTTTLENSKVFFSTPTGGIYGKVRVNTFRNAIGAHYLPYSSKYVAPSSIDIVRPWFEMIRYGEAVHAKGTLKKSLLPPREKVVPYTKFISLLMMHKMKEGYGDKELTLYPTQVFSVNNWALKPNQHEKPPFTSYMLAICSADKLVAFKAPKPSSNVERVPQGTKPGAKPGHKKHSTSLKQPFVKRKESSSTMDSNPSQPLVSTPVDIGMHKKDQQATGGPTSVEVTSEARANPQLSSGMSAFNLNEPIYLASFIIHSESASGNDASTASTAEADPGNSSPSDFVAQQLGMNEGTKNTSYDHLFADTDPHVLADQTKSVSEGLETVLTQPITGKRVSSVAKQIKEETSSIIKLGDVAKLVSHVQPSFKDLDLSEDDLFIVVDNSDEDEDAEVHATENVKTEDTSIPKSSSPKSSQIQELTNQVLLFQYQKHKLKLKKIKAEVALLKAQPSFPNMEQLDELLDLPSKFNELTEEVKGLKKQVHELDIELPGDLKEIPSKLKEFTKTVTSLTSQVTELKTFQWELLAKFLSLLVQVASVQAKLKTLDALPGLLLNVTKALNKFAQALYYTSSKAEDQGFPSAGQAATMPAEEEKNTNQATIS
ncbi:hypothetical protein Tco_0002875 [Tanacetum coccineum]